ncbi:MAG: LicD family protein [Bacteroidales bacterium]|nr:LicD family protein [Bacteroidales bacterium]
MRETIVKLAEALGLYKWLMAIDTRRQMRRQNRAFARYGLETLAQAEAAAAECGAHLFLAFGSLLGAYREKGFIPFDCDLDTGLLATERSEAFLSAMKRHGFDYLRQYYVKATGRVCEEKFSYRGVHLDVHYFYPTPDGGLGCELCLPHETKSWREANATDGFPSVLRTCCNTTFSAHDFLGVQVYLPDRAEEWLKTLYGESFMTPNPNWTMSDHQRLARIEGERLYRRTEAEG